MTQSHPTTAVDLARLILDQIEDAYADAVPLESIVQAVEERCMAVEQEAEEAAAWPQPEIEASMFPFDGSKLFTFAIVYAAGAEEVDVHATSIRSARRFAERIAEDVYDTGWLRIEALPAGGSGGLVQGWRA